VTQIQCHLKLILAISLKHGYSVVIAIPWPTLNKGTSTNKVSKPFRVFVDVINDNASRLPHIRIG
jgi:hypothetical protein